MSVFSSPTGMNTSPISTPSADQTFQWGSIAFHETVVSSSLLIATSGSRRALWLWAVRPGPVLDSAPGPP